MEDELLVRGEGEARSLPDTAAVLAAVSGEGTSREDAYASAAADARSVDAVLERHRTGIRRVGHATLVVHPRSKWKKGESVRTGWVARRASVIELSDLSLLGDLLAELASAGADIGGPTWQLDPANPAHSAARRVAAEDARRRADDYAAALGLEVLAIAWASEPGLRVGEGSGHHGAIAFAAGAPVRAAGGDEVMDISPNEMTIHAALEVAFRLGRPAT